MAKYRKKPIIVDAVMFKRYEGLEDGYHVNYSDGKLGGVGCIDKADLDSKIHEINYAFIKTLEGNMAVSEGDWIITGIQGERYPIKPDIFEATYDVVEDTFTEEEWASVWKVRSVEPLSEWVKGVPLNIRNKPSE